MSIIFVTSNENKFEEAQKIAREYEVNIKHQNVSYEEIQADTLEEVVKPSTQQAYKIAGEPCFVEDAGLFINNLNGFPGPYSSYVFKTIGNDGILRLMSNVNGRGAEFRSAVGYCGSNLEPKVFKGKINGKISEEKRGSEGFGYDPIFIPQGGSGETFAEMGIKAKNDFSHRAAAIEKFVKWYSRKKKAEEGG